MDKFKKMKKKQKEQQQKEEKQIIAEEAFEVPIFIPLCFHASILLFVFGWCCSTNVVRC